MGDCQESEAIHSRGKAMQAMPAGEFSILTPKPSLNKRTEIFGHSVHKKKKNNSFFSSTSKVNTHLPQDNNK